MSGNCYEKINTALGSTIIGFVPAHAPYRTMKTTKLLLLEAGFVGNARLYKVTIICGYDLSFNYNRECKIPKLKELRSHSCIASFTCYQLFYLISIVTSVNCEL